MDRAGGGDKWVVYCLFNLSFPSQRLNKSSFTVIVYVRYLCSSPYKWRSCFITAVIYVLNIFEKLINLFRKYYLKYLHQPFFELIAYLAKRCCCLESIIIKIDAPRKRICESMMDSKMVNWDICLLLWMWNVAFLWVVRTHWDAGTCVFCVFWAWLWDSIF